MADFSKRYSVKELSKREHNYFGFCSFQDTGVVLVSHGGAKVGSPVEIVAEKEFASGRMLLTSGFYLPVNPEASIDLPGNVVARFEDGAPAVLIVGKEIHFAFDPVAAMENILFERYVDAEKPLTAKLPFHYHRVPGPLRKIAHRMVSFRCAGEEGFPAWPAEPAADALRELVCSAVSAAAGGGSVSRAPWPGGKKFAVILSHDMDTAASFKALEKIAHEEEERGLRSCWNVVGKSYDIDRAALKRLKDAGHEVALHGYNHDNKLAYLPKEAIGNRLDACSDLIREFDIRGFRSPALFVSDALYESLAGKFEWSSSVIDTDMNSLIAPRRGACTVFPFLRSGVLEIPLTVPLDDRLLAMKIEGGDFVELVKRKIDWIAEVGGVVCIGNHPEPHLSGNRKMIDLYKEILDSLSSHSEAWFALPSEVADYWKNSTTGSCQ